MGDNQGDTASNSQKDLASKLRLVPSGKKLYQTIVDTPFDNPLHATFMGLGIIVLLLVSDDGKEINRVALSNTDQAANAVKTSEKSFKEIKIPLSFQKNSIAIAIRTRKTQFTEDWKDLFLPALSPSSARFNQATAGIDASIVEPLNGYESGAALIFSFFKYPNNTQEIKKFTQQYADIVAAELQNRKDKS